MKEPRLGCDRVYLLTAVQHAEFGALLLSIHQDVEHGADRQRHTELRRLARFLHFGIKRRFCSARQDYKIFWFCLWPAFRQLLCGLRERRQKTGSVTRWVRLFLVVFQVTTATYFPKICLKLIKVVSKFRGCVLRRPTLSEAYVTAPSLRPSSFAPIGWTGQIDPSRSKISHNALQAEQRCLFSLSAMADEPREISIVLNKKLAV